MLDFRLLGPLEVRRDGSEVPLGPPKQRAVLAVLLLDAGTVVSTDRIVDTVWGDEAPGSVLASLQAYVSNLRRLLRDPDRVTSPLTRQAPGYRCDVEPESTDVGRFLGAADTADAALAEHDWAAATHAAEAALGLWRGPLLADLADEEWVRVAATTLEERRTATRQALVTGLLGLGRIGPAVAASARLTADQPLDERACWLQAVALFRAGRAPEALDVIRAYARRLDEELGLEPGPALRDLDSAVLRQDPELHTWPAAPDHPAVPGVVEPERAPIEPASVGSTGPDALVGRREELAAIDAVLDEARRADGSGWLVLDGVAGIGKTRLADEVVRRWLHGGGRAIRTGCPDDDSLPAWWPMRQVLRDLGADPDTVLVPPSGTDIDAARYATYERVRAVLAAAAHERPTLLVVDDVHWADQTSLAFVTLLAQSPPVPGLLVVLTTRPPAPGSPVARLLAAVARSPHCRYLEVPPLSPAEVSELADRVSAGAVADSEAGQLAVRTGGNPFFVTEYARLPDSVRRSGGVPGAVRSVLERRLAGVDSEVLGVLRTAAVIGHTLDTPLLERVTRMDRDELADLLDDAADEHLIVPAPTGIAGTGGAAGNRSGAYEFVHALMREQIAQGVSGHRRQRLHLRVADALTEAADGGDTDALVRRAAHLVAALPLADAAETVAACRAAAVDAENRWQSNDAATWWANAITALDLLPPGDETVLAQRDDLVVARVAALARAGRGETAVDAVDEALEVAMRTGRLAGTGRLAATLLRSAGAWPWAVFGDDGTRTAGMLARLTALETVVRDDPASRVRVLATLAAGSCYHPDPAVPDAISREAIALAEQLGDPEILADALLGRCLLYSGVASHAAELVELLDRIGTLPHAYQRVDEVLRHNLGAQALFCLGRVDEAEASIRAGALGADLLRLPVSRAQLRWIAASILQWHGRDLDEIEEQMRYAFEVHRQTELYQYFVMQLAELSAAWDRSDLSSLPPTTTIANLSWISLVPKAARGEPGSYEALTVEVERDEPEIWTAHGRFTLLAHVVCDLGARDLAGEVRRRLEPHHGLVANIGQVGGVGPVDLALTRLCLLQGDVDAARTYLAAATELCERGRAVRHLARCRALAATLDDAG